ncbi:MAG: cupin domain-containing protein [Caldilineaceae bacterium]|nr:cupin domain-containing protein [Caldilineaceae bacterium]
MQLQRYQLSITEAQLSAYDSHTERRLADLAGYFADAAAYQARLATADPVLYTVYNTERPAAAGDLISGITLLHAGQIGDEYFMTKGHFHAVRATAEVYYCLRGTGVMVLEAETGTSHVEPFPTGSVIHIPPGWAHRTVNVGDDDLLFFWVCPANAGHDYGTIAERGFRERITTAHPVVAQLRDLSSARH